MRGVGDPGRDAADDYGTRPSFEWVYNGTGGARNLLVSTYTLCAALTDLVVLCIHRRGAPFNLQHLRLRDRTFGLDWDLDHF